MRSRTEKSAEAVVAVLPPEAMQMASDREGPNERESETNVSLGKDRRQKSTQAELPLESRGEAPKVQRSGETGPATNEDERSGSSS